MNDCGWAPIAPLLGHTTLDISTITTHYHCRQSAMCPGEKAYWAASFTGRTRIMREPILYSACNVMTATCQSTTRELCREVEEEVCSAASTCPLPGLLHAVVLVVLCVMALLDKPDLLSSTDFFQDTCAESRVVGIPACHAISCLPEITGPPESAGDRHDAALLPGLHG